MALRVLGFGLQYWMVVMADNKKNLLLFCILSCTNLVVVGWDWWLVDFSLL
jgi:hypothetical protein